MQKTKFIALFMSLSISLAAYSQNGEIWGKIKDRNAENIAKVKIVVVDDLGIETDIKTVSDFDGNFSLKSLKPGKYNLQFSCKGYISEAQKGVVVNANKYTLIDITLDPAPPKTKGKSKK